nr:hypothetical protein [Tanacetum cinerariifolium]
EDTTEPAQEERAVECTYETLGSLVQRILGVESVVAALTERITELERDNRRLGGTASVEAEEMEAHKAVMNLEPLNENEDEQEGNGENGNGNRGNGNRGRNGNGNKNRNHGMNYRDFMPVA